MASSYSAGSASVSIGPNLKGFGRKLAQELRRVNAPQFEVEVTPDLSGFARDLSARLERIHASLEVPVSLDVDIVRFNRELQTRLDALRATVRVDAIVDTARARAELDRLRRSGGTIDVDVDVDRNGSARRGITGLVTGLAGLGTKAALVGTAGAAGIAAIGGAAGVAGGAVGALALGFVGVGAAAAPALLAAGVGLKGLADGASEFNKQFEAQNQAINEQIGQLMGPMLTAWNQVGNAAKLGFAEALVPAFEGLGKLMTTLQPQVVALSSSMGQLGSQFTGVFTSAAGSQVLTDLLSGVKTMIDAIGPGLTVFATGIRSLLANVTPALNSIGNAIGTIMASIGTALGSIPTEFFESFAQMLASIGPLLGNLIGALSTLGSAVMPALVTLFTALGQTLQAIAPSLGQLGAALANALTPILPVLGQVISALATGLTPILGPVSQGIQTIGNVIAELLPIAAPVFTQLMALLADLLAAVAPLLPPLFELARAILEPLITIVSALVEALAPFISALVESLQPVIAALAPILAEIGVTLAEAFTKAITTLTPLMMPLVEAFLGLLQALLPMLPALVEIAVQLLPILLTQFKVLAPVITKIIELLTWVVTNVIMPLVVPALGKIAEWVGTVSTAVSGMGDKFGEVLDNIKDWVGTAKDWIVEKFTAVVDFFKEMPGKIADAASGMWDGIKDAFRNMMNWLIEKWNNFSITIDIPDAIPGLPDDFTLSTPDIPYFADGGRVTGGQRGKDSVPAMLMPGEHVLTTSDVAAMGGQQGVYDFRKALHFADGGAVGSYGLPAGSSVSGASSFPDWVQKLAQQFGVTPSTYAGHQESNRGEAGYAPNPDGLNRGIDWGADVPSMQKFAEHLMQIAPQNETLEQVIWMNPTTGQTLGWAGRNDVSSTGYYADDYAGHQDHVHMRASGPVPMPAADPVQQQPQTSTPPAVTTPPATTTPPASTSPTSTVKSPSESIHAFGEKAGGILADSFLKIIDPGGSLGPDTWFGAADRYTGPGRALQEHQQQDQQVTPSSPSTVTPTNPATPNPQQSDPNAPPTIAYDASAGAEQWRPLAEWAINYVNKTLKGQPQTTAMVEQIDDESGGNPKAQNDWDSNAAAGTPSGGLLQVIEPTFQAYRDPKFADDKFDPTANLVAALNYYAATYGQDLTSRWGHGKGGYRFGGYTGNYRTDEVAGVVHGREFVVNAQATRRNLPLLREINNGGTAAAAQSWRPGVQIDNHVTVSNERSQMRMLRRQDENVIMQYAGARA